MTINFAFNLMIFIIFIIKAVIILALLLQVLERITIYNGELMKILSCLFLMFLMFSGCAPVRSTQKSHTPDNDAKNGKGQEVVKKETRRNHDRFSDTTLITLQDVSANTQNDDMESMFVQAVEEFRNEQYSRACPKFNMFAHTFAKGDSLLYEAMFFDCECKIMDDEIIDAKIILDEILDDSETTDKIREKALVRLGQIECVLGNEDKAQEYFKIFREEYPDSKYKKLANCDAIE